MDSTSIWLNICRKRSNSSNAGRGGRYSVFSWTAVGVGARREHAYLYLASSDNLLRKPCKYLRRNPSVLRASWSLTIDVWRDSEQTIPSMPSHGQSRFGNPSRHNAHSATGCFDSTLFAFDCSMTARKCEFARSNSFSTSFLTEWFRLAVRNHHRTARL